MGSPAMSTALRHVTSINDLTNREVEQVFALADRFLSELGDTTERRGRRRSSRLTTHRIGRSGRSGTGSILASLFYEPSTRTRLSFESAMLRLGGGTITSADPATSSAAKGESLADTVRVVSNYADAIVIRHPRDGAAKLAAQYAAVPVINGGDGAHEHPTQTLCDLFTLRREKKKLKHLNVVISGDLRGSRTIHSFVYALARFGANIMLMPGAKGMELPHHVDWRLRNEFNCLPVPKEKYDAQNAVDALYVTAEEPHQLSLMAGAQVEYNVKLKKSIDVVYVTRYQKERWAEQHHEYMKVDANFLRDNKYKHTSVMHPLPRVGELDISLDRNPRAAYFQQASYGVPIRMALIASLLGFEKQPLERFESGFRKETYEIYNQQRNVGIRCINSNCIVHDPHEGPYASNRYYLVTAKQWRLRCFYCETDIEQFLIGHRRTRHYELSRAQRERAGGNRLKDMVFFADSAEAEAAGYAARRSAQPALAAGGR
jgi:aspartate carbamoyltransferase catalytic subunit